MNKANAQKVRTNALVRELYVILSRAYYVPAIQIEGLGYAEPFQTLFETYFAKLNKCVTPREVQDYLEKADTPFWGKHVFIPEIGRISCEKNIVSQLLLHDEEREDYTQQPDQAGRYHFLISNYLSVFPYCPFLIKYKKKVQWSPTISQYLKRRRSKSVHASHGIHLYIHFYPYGLFVINLAISITSTTGIYPHELIDWLRQVKSSKVRDSQQVQFEIRTRFKGNLTALFDFIWARISKSVLSNNRTLFVKSPIYDSIRLKPINKLDHDLIQRANDTSQREEVDWKEYWGRDWTRYVQAYMESHQRELSLEDYQFFGIDPEPYSYGKVYVYEGSTNDPKLKPYERELALFLDELRQSFTHAKKFHSLPGYIEELYDLDLSISRFFDRHPESGSDYLLSYLHKALRDGILQIIREKFPISLQPREIAGLLSKSPDWSSLQVRKIDVQSMFGKYIGDLIIARSQSTLIVYNNWPTRKQLSLVFHWKLQAVQELACAQKMILDHFTKAIRDDIYKSPAPDLDRDQKHFRKEVLEFITRLSSLHKRLPSKYRKWYHQLAREMGVARLQNELIETIEAHAHIFRNVSPKSIQNLVYVQKSAISHLHIGDVGRDSASSSKVFNINNTSARIDQIHVGDQILDSAHDRPDTICILFLTAEPGDTLRLRLGEEAREIQEKLQLAKLRERFELHMRMSVRPADISQALLDVQPQVVHFSGHGTLTGALCFEDQLGATRVVPPEAIASLFEQFALHVKCVLLNACYSKFQAEAIAKHIEYVVGMNKAIGDRAAIAFAIGFYQALGAGRTFEDAYKLGCIQISLQGIPEHSTPILLKRQS